MALNAYPQASNPRPGAAAHDRGGPGHGRRHPGRPGPDAAYAAQHHPKLRLHLSGARGSATSADAINFYREQFGIVRAVLPARCPWSRFGA